MATSSPWVGTPTTPVPGPIAAFGVDRTESDKDRQKRTGVDPGAQGYVSGQVAPAGVAPSYSPTGNASAPPATNNANVQAGIPRTDSETKTSALSTGNTNNTNNTNGPLNISSTPSDPTTGTTKGQSTVPKGGDASPTVNVLNRVQPGLGDKLDPGSQYIDKYFTPTLADLSPTQAAQAAAFGAAGNFDAERYNYKPGAAPNQDRVALDTTNPDQIRAQQLQALQALTGAANGTVPSAAELQLRAQAAKNNAANLGAARALGGRSAGGVAHAATVSNTEANITTNANAAQMRAAEQAQARQALVSALSGTRGQDIDVSTTNANLNQAANANNLQAQLRENELAEAHRKALIEAQLQALGTGTNAASATVGASAKNAEAQNKAQGDTIGGASKLLAFL